MQYREFKIIASDGLTLRGREWIPDGATQAVVCLAHGLGEHGGRYSRMAEQFLKEGYLVVTYDQRGHGLTEGRRGHARDFTELALDLNTFLEEISRRHTGLPRFLYGHSLGGSLVVYYALRHAPELSGVIASAPMFRLAYTPPKWKSSLLNLLLALRIDLSLASGIETAALSQDVHAVHLYQSDPLVHDRIAPSLALGMLEAGEWNLEHASEFPLPLLLMHGRADRITSMEASAEFARRMGERCTLKLWDGLYHELHNEPERQEVAACVMEWMAGLRRSDT